ncbi:peptidoglycan DD-metalloendopeptidase family protein [Microcoleus sp. PH2017_39_LGB_O_B]|uniref:peptidoglycan DD-metalloendopeptidase family protein n=1 Tax=Microcoleus sp. PH2017_39_LGB_O_B TaxID=2798849 RepID=UPI0025D14883|nr:peptidoglycan DD-metalloendopeptidase family protein [Microcoleus sp. PH2017_39_LGB_O_B]
METSPINPSPINPSPINPSPINPSPINPSPINPSPTLPPSSIFLNGHTIGGNFYPVFQNSKGTLGNPTSDVINYNGVSYQTFDKGSIVSSKNGTFPLYGAIRQEFLKTGGLDGWLGAPKSAEKGQGDGTLIQYFEKGYISWNGVKAIAYREGDGKPSVSVPSISVPNQPILGDDRWWDLQTGDSFLYSNQEDPKNNSKLYSELQTIERSQKVRQMYVDLSKAIFKGSLLESDAGYAYDKGYIEKAKIGNKVGWIHSGIDMSASTTNVIHSPVDGIVVQDISDYGPGSGRAICVQEKVDGKRVNRFWWYLHLASGKSKIDQPVTAKETVIGSPGIIGGMAPHLHLTVATTSDKNAALNVLSPGVTQAKAAINELTARTMSPLQAFWEAQNKVLR